MKRVVIESPFAAPTKAGIDKNLRYLRACVSIHRGESPYASHGLYTQPGVLDDKNPEERALGIAAGFVWREVAELTVVYTDLGVTPGMLLGVADAEKRGCPIARRTLPNWKPGHDDDNEKCPWNDPETFANPATAGLPCSCPEGDAR